MQQGGEIGDAPESEPVVSPGSSVAVKLNVLNGRVGGASVGTSVRPPLVFREFGRDSCTDGEAGGVFVREEG